MPLSFPYPVLGSVRRPVGQGCKVCIYKTICPGLYWLRRYGTGWNLENGWTGPDDHNGIQCAAWSDDPTIPLPTPNADDMNEAAYMWHQRIQSEADRNGITSPTTGTSRQP